MYIIHIPHTAAAIPNQGDRIKTSMPKTKFLHPVSNFYRFYYLFMCWIYFILIPLYYYVPNEIDVVLKRSFYYYYRHRSNWMRMLYSSTYYSIVCFSLILSDYSVHSSRHYIMLLQRKIVKRFFHYNNRCIV